MLRGYSDVEASLQTIITSLLVLQHGTKARKETMFCRRNCDRWTVRRDIIGIARLGIGRALFYGVSVSSGKNTVLP